MTEPNERLTDMDEAKEMRKVYAIIKDELKDFETAQFEAWTHTTESVSQKKLKQSLLTRDADGQLHVNFDPALVSLLREVKYLLTLKLEPPQSAMDIYKHDNTYRAQRGNLDLIVNRYVIVVSLFLSVCPQLTLRQP